MIAKCIYFDLITDVHGNITKYLGVLKRMAIFLKIPDLP